VRVGDEDRDGRGRFRDHELHNGSGAGEIHATIVSENYDGPR
jgi:hypothetical protein